MALLSSAMDDLPYEYMIKTAKTDKKRKSPCSLCSEAYAEGSLMLGSKEEGFDCGRAWSFSHLTCAPNFRFDRAADIYDDIDKIPGIDDDEGTIKSVRDAHKDAKSRQNKAAAELAELQTENETENVLIFRSELETIAASAKKVDRAAECDYTNCKYVIEEEPCHTKTCEHCDAGFDGAFDSLNSLRLGRQETAESRARDKWSWAHATCVPMARWDNAADVYGTLDAENPDVPGNLHLIPGVGGSESTAEVIRDVYAAAVAEAFAEIKEISDDYIEAAKVKAVEAAEKKVEAAKVKAEAKEAAKVEVEAAKVKVKADPKADNSSRRVSKRLSISAA